MKGKTKAEALKAKAFTESWLAKGPITVETCKRDAFGRVLGKVTRKGEYLSEKLVEASHGVSR